MRSKLTTTTTTTNEKNVHEDNNHGLSRNIIDNSIAVNNPMADV